MATIYELHRDSPQQRKIDEIIRELTRGAVMLYPTDTVYAIGCDLKSKNAIERVRKIKQISNDKPLTFLCSSLSNIAEYAMVADPAYRLMKSLIPGPYTFILPATKQVPKLVQNPKRKTTGIRVPDHEICQTLLKNLGNPIISTSAHLVDEEGNQPTLNMEKAYFFDHLESVVDIIIDTTEEMGQEMSTIVDLTDDQPTIVRQGIGEIFL